jgi:hypothetical protein
LLLGADVEYRMTTGGVEYRESLSQSYLSLELSIRFGGGRKPAAPPPLPPAPPPTSTLGSR